MTDSNYSSSREGGHRTYDEYGGRREFGNNSSHGREDREWRGSSSRFYPRDYRPNHDLSPKRRKVGREDYDGRAEDYKERDYHSSRFSERWPPSSSSSWRFQREREPQSRSDSRREGSFSDRERRLSRSGERHSGYYYNGRDREPGDAPSSPTLEKSTVSTTTSSSGARESTFPQSTTQPLPSTTSSTTTPSTATITTTPSSSVPSFRDRGDTPSRTSSKSHSGDTEPYYQHRSYSYYQQKDYDFGGSREREKDTYYGKQQRGSGSSSSYADYKFVRRDYPRSNYTRGSYPKDREYDYERDYDRDEYEYHDKRATGGYSYYNRKFDKDEGYYNYKYDKDLRDGSQNYKKTTEMPTLDTSENTNSPPQQYNPEDVGPILESASSEKAEDRQLSSSLSNDSQEASLPVEPMTPTLEPKKKRLGWGTGLATFEKKTSPAEEEEQRLKEEVPMEQIKTESFEQIQLQAPEIVTERENSIPWSPPSEPVVALNGPSLLPEPNLSRPTDPRLKLMSESIEQTETSSPDLGLQKISPPVNLEPKLILPAKEEVLSGIEKLDAEISQTEAMIQRLKRASGPKKSGSIVMNSNIGTHGYMSTEALIAMIYEQNQERAAQSKEELNRLNSSQKEVSIPPVYKQPSDLKLYHENLEKHKSIKHLVASLVHKRRVEAKEKEKTLVEKYKRARDLWKKKIQKYEEKLEKKNPPPKKEVAPPPPPPPPIESPTITSGRRSLNSSRSRGGQNVTNSPSLSFGGKNNSKLCWSDVVRSEADFDQVLDQLREEANKDPNSKYLKTIAKVPPMIMKEFKIPSFVDRNGRVEDPLQHERERKAINPWTDDEKSIFLRKYLLYPKNFSKIATYLEHKTTADVIWYYYNHKRTLDLKKLVLDQQKKKGYQRKQVTMIEAEPSPTIVPKTKSSMLRSNVQEYAEKQQPTSAKEVASPYISSPMGDSATTSMWSETEKSIFMEALAKHGKDFKSIALLVGTKNQFQCKNFFNNSKKKLGLEKIIEQSTPTPTPSPSVVSVSVTTKRKPEPEPEIIETESKEEQSSKKVRIATCWSPEEKDLFMKYFRLFGKDWKKIGDHIPSKTQNQIRNFFQNSKHKLGLLQIEANRLRDVKGKPDHLGAYDTTIGEGEEMGTRTRRKKRVVIQDDEDQEQIIVEDEMSETQKMDPSKPLTTEDLLAKESDLPDEIIDDDDNDPVEQQPSRFDQEQIEFFTNHSSSSNMSLQSAEDLEESDGEAEGEGPNAEDAFDLPSEGAAFGHPEDPSPMEVAESGDIQKTLSEAEITVTNQNSEVSMPVQSVSDPHRTTAESTVLEQDESPSVSSNLPPIEHASNIVELVPETSSAILTESGSAEKILEPVAEKPVQAEDVQMDESNSVPIPHEVTEGESPVGFIHEDSPQHEEPTAIIQSVDKVSPSVPQSQEISQPTNPDAQQANEEVYDPESPT